MERKKVTYRVFTIQNALLTHDASDLKDELRTRLAQSNIEHRLIPVNEDDDSINDLLSSFAPATGTSDPRYFYGVMMRLKPAKEIKALPDDYMKLPELSEAQLKEIQEVAGKTICSRIFHFLIMGTFLITDLPQIQNISVFEKYINRFLERLNTILDHICITKIYASMTLARLSSKRHSLPCHKMTEIRFLYNNP